MHASYQHKQPAHRVFPGTDFLFRRYLPKMSLYNLVLHPPTPSTLSPLEMGGEGRGEGGSHIHVLCPFGTLLVTLYQFDAKSF